MVGANHRLSWAAKALMAFVLACTLAFPYAALADDAPSARQQDEASEVRQLSDSESNALLSEAGDGEEDFETASDASAESYGFDGEISTDDEAAPSVSDEPVPSDSGSEEDPVASLSEASMLADHTVADEQQLRDALAAATANPDQAVSIELASDIRLTSTIAIALKQNDQVTIGSDNKATLYAPANARHFAVSGSGASSSTECLLFKNIVLDGEQNGGGLLFSTAPQPYYINEVPGSGSSDVYSLTITNCTAVNGGAIETPAGTQLELHGLTLTGNSADARGGAIYANSGATISLYQSSVKSNHAGSAGGGLYVGAPSASWIDAAFCGKTSFESNTAPNGGALYAEGNVRATASTFRLNQATVAGGAIYVQAPGATVEFNECGDGGTPTRFEKNEAGESGGALFGSVAGDGALNVVANRTEFTDNKAKDGNGGAMALYGSTVDVNIDGCGDGCNTRSAFVANTATKSGGAIYAEGIAQGHVSASYALFIANTARADGGAIFVTGERAMVSTEEGCAPGIASTFQGNTAGAAGGAIRIVSTGDFGNYQSYADFEGRNGVFTNNRAVGDGGAVSLFGKGDVSVAVYGIDFGRNSSTQGSGGAIAAEGDEVWLDAENGIESDGSYRKMIFAGNTAAINGGALYLKGLTDGSGSESAADVNFGSVSVEDNEALSGDGGGLFAEADYVELDLESYNSDPQLGKTVFSGNRAYGDGGGIRAIGADYAYAAAYDMDIENNTALGQGGAAGNGGGVCLTGGELTFNLGYWRDESTAKLGGNSAANDGGAVYIGAEEEAYVELENVEATGNTAQNNGGAVYMQGEEGAIYVAGDRSSSDPDAMLGSLSENHAIEGSGGAVYIAGGIEEVYFDTQSIYGNSAGLHGGALYVDPLANGQASTSVELYMSELVVEANEAGGDGGAIYVADGRSEDVYGNVMDFGESMFIGNEAHGGSGGALYLGAHAEMLEMWGESDEEPLVFSDNKAALHGGAVYAGEGLDYAWIEGADFRGNIAAYNGGALYFAGIEDRGDPHPDGAVEIYEDIFDGNIAGLNGGAIWLPYKHLSQLLIDNEYNSNVTVFSNNVASRETESHLVKNAADVAMHGEKVLTSQFSVNPYAQAATPFTYAYSNFDVSYIDVYLVTYDGNGATGGETPVDRTSYATGEAATVLGQGTLERSGFTFGGWALAPGSTEPVGDTVQVGDADVVLYAIWHANPVDPTNPTNPTNPTDPNSGKPGGSKVQGLATAGDSLPYIAVFGALALAALAAIVLVQRRLKYNRGDSR